MRSTLPHNPDLKRPSNRWDLAVEWILIAMLAFAPLAFGAVDAWSEMVMLCLATALAVCLAGKFVFNRDDRLHWTWAYVPIGLFLALAFIQLIPLPASLISLVSPQTVRVKSDLLAGAPGVSNLFTLSFYPHATRHDLCIVLVGVIVFVAVFNVYRRTDQVKRLLTAVATIGGLITVLALVQDYSAADKIYGMFVMPPAHVANSGTFVNHSHFAQFMNLSIGAALGLLLLHLREMFPHGDVQPARLFEVHIDENARAVCLLMLMVVTGVISIVLSLSRGGVIGMLAGAGLTGVVLGMTRRKAGGRGAIVAMLALVSFGAVLWIGFDAMSARFDTTDPTSAADGRWQILLDLTKLWKMFPLAGTGLGTHIAVFPMVDTSEYGRAANYAENEYAQVLEEMGIIGLALVLAFVGWVCVAFARSMGRHRPVYSACLGLGYGLCAVMIHSFSDFGQHILANVCLSAAFCGLLLSLPQWARVTSSHQRGPVPAMPVASPRARFAGIAIAGLLALVLLGFLPGANNARLAAGHWVNAAKDAVALRDDNWDGSNDDYDDLISEQWLAADLQPGNVEYQFLLNRYRWHSLDRSRDDAGHLVLTPDQVGWYQRIVDELQATRLICPTYGPIRTLAGQIELFVLEDQEASGEQDLRAGRRLSPQDPYASLMTGRLEAQRGNWDASLDDLRHAVKVDERLFTEAVGTYIYQVDRPDLAVMLAGENPDRIVQVAGLLDKSKAQPEQIAAAKEQAFAALTKVCKQPDVGSSAVAALADWCRRRGEREVGIAYYRRALDDDHGQFAWRLNLAILLEQTGKFDEARREAQICLQHQPGLLDAQRLVNRVEARLTTQPAPPTDSVSSSPPG